MSTTTSTLHVPAKTAPPFRIGDLVEYRGWRGRLEAGVNPFGPSGRERLIVTDDLGIEYWHDPVTDILFSSPRFSQASLDESYQQPTAHIDTRQFIGFDRRAWEHQADRSFVVSRLKADLVSQWLKPPSRILDVGCHVGLFVMLAQEAGFECQGIDVSADAVRIGTEQLGIAGLSACTLAQADIEAESFDAVMIWDVLEHLYDLTEMVQQCATVLRRGGYLFAQVPNHRGITAQLKTLACKLRIRHGRFDHFGFPWHLYHFSPKSLTLLARRAGLEAVQIRSFSHRTKAGVSGQGLSRWITRRIEQLAWSDYLYIVARKPAPI
ncbi:MAG: class I SAM-dependent methyltransferase [Planctomycetes bacterium]|nr:class I SAM-dependent methyltransferase [Planctomycetota bacterium]